MIHKTYTFQLNPVHKDDKSEVNKKQNDDDELFYNPFNIQSSTFFNRHQFSSKSSDFEKYTDTKGEINFDFFHIKLKSTLSKDSTILKPNNQKEKKLNKSFEFPVNRKNIYKKLKVNNILTNEPSMYFQNRANSAVQPFSNYILKSEFKKFNEKENNNQINNNNMILNYYGNNNFILKNRKIANSRENYILDIVNDYNDDINYDENVNDNKNNLNLSEYEEGENNNDDEYISNAQSNFTLNYLNKIPQDLNYRNMQPPLFIYNNNKNTNIDSNQKANNITSQNNNNNNRNFNIHQNEIKNNLHSNNNNNDFYSKAITLIRDQTGCRFLQKKIDEDPSISDKLFDILYNETTTMCTDLFGNYVVQKLLENISINNLQKFTELISLQFIFIATSTYGTRVIQKLLDVLYKNNNESIEKKMLFNTLNNLIIANIVELSSDSNSCHIIIKYVNIIKYPNNNDMYKGVYKNFIPLCKDKHGCCVIQKCLEAGNEEQNEKLLSLSSEYCDELISDQFGNYVIQFVVGLNKDNMNKKIVKVILSDLVNLCKEKYASNVIEKFLNIQSIESKEILNVLVNNENMIHELIIDQFGNYIIQRILSIVSPNIRGNMLKYIVSWYEEIKNLSFGQRLIAKLNERYNEFTSMVNNTYGNSILYNPNVNNNNQFNNNNNNIGNINFIQMNNYMIAPNVSANGSHINQNQIYNNSLYNNNQRNSFRRGIQNNFNNQFLNNMNMNMNMNMLNQLQYQNMMLNYMQNMKQNNVYFQGKK